MFMKNADDKIFVIGFHQIQTHMYCRLTGKETGLFLFVSREVSASYDANDLGPSEIWV